jgi:hypothetical protein
VADKVAVAEKRARAEDRLRQVVDRLSSATGVDFNPPAVPANRYPELYAAQLVEGVADFLERLADNPARTAERKVRP